MSSIGGIFGSHADPGPSIEDAMDHIDEKIDEVNKNIEERTDKIIAHADENADKILIAISLLKSREQLLSSSADHFPFFLSGRNTLCQRSRHCLRFLPERLRVNKLQLLLSTPAERTRRIRVSSSCVVRNGKGSYVS